MLVVHNIDYLLSFMNIGLIILIDLIFLILVVALALFTCHCIYEYVCHELDNCTFFGEDKDA